MTLIEELGSVQHQSLDTLSSKIIFMIIRNNKDETGWTTISLNELARLTGLTQNGANKVVRKLLAVSLIEKDRTGLKASQTSKYRALEL
jgi:DNA-binding MarR family transcriptional regulator